MKKTERIILTGLLAAIVFVLQSYLPAIRFGAFEIATPLIPIVVGAALCGIWVGAFLGGVFGFAILVSVPSVQAFMNVTASGTIITIMLRGILAGLAAGFAYKLLKKRGTLIATIAAGFICPVVNTGMFILSCYLLFSPAIQEWYPEVPVTKTILVTFVGLNFFFELAFNLVFAPAIAKIINIGYKTFRKKAA